MKKNDSFEKVSVKKRLLNYKDLSNLYGQSPQFWRRQYWRGNIKNCNLLEGKHLFDEQDIINLINDSKTA